MSKNLRHPLGVWSIIFLLYLTTFVVEGPLRYLLSLVGASSFLYIRDLFLLSLIVYGVWNVAASRVDLNSTFPVILFLVAIHFFVGLAGDVSLGAGLFAFKILMPLICGTLLANTLANAQEQFYRWLWLAWCVAVFGVILNSIIGSFPWEGGDFVSIFGATEISKQWFTGGVPRLAGFSRASYDAAMIVGLSGLALAIRCTSIYSSFIVVAITIYVVHLTTTKGMMLAVMASALVIFWVRFEGRHGAVPKLITTLFFVALVGLPVYTLINPLYSTEATAYPSFLGSVIERVVYMWPLSFEGVDSAAGYVFGNGLGSIGTPQRMFFSSSSAASYADNAFVFLYVSFGFISLVYLACILWKTSLSASRLKLGMLPVTTGVVFFTYGMTGNMLEQPYMAAFIGICLGLGVDRDRALK